MVNELVNQPEVRDLMSAVSTIEDYAVRLIVSSPAHYEDAAEHLKKVMAAKKRVESMRTEITAPLNESLKAANNLFRTPGDKLAQAERLIKSKLSAFQSEQERLQRMEQDKADAEARKERERLAELERKAREAGRESAAEKHAARAEAVVAPVIERQAPKVAGVLMRDVWLFKIEDPALVPREYLEVDAIKIRRYVNAMKADAVIPGVRIYSEKQVAAASR